MKKSRLLALLVLFLISGVSFGQNLNKKFKMEGVNPQSIAVNKTFTESVEIFPFDKNGKRIYGLDASANIELNGEKALVRLLLLDNNFNEYLIYESYNLLLEEETSFSIENICEETSILDNVLPYSIQIEIENATLELKSLSYLTALEQGKNIATIKKEKKKAQNEEKINKINNNLKKQRKSWVAGPTSVSELSYQDRKKLYGQGTFPAGFEYYAGGVISASSTESSSTDDGSLKSATATSSPYVDNWDWRDRHGNNWITSIKNQGTCGACWAFSATGTTEALTNLYFNQQLNLDLSEQDLVSCSGAGDCTGGVSMFVLEYIISKGVVDEAAFPYDATDQPCSIKATNPSELIKIGGKIHFGSDTPRTEDILKDLIIHNGPVDGGIYSWNHTMTLVGYKVVKEGDVFHYSADRFSGWKTIYAGDPLIGKTVWIFKNSWGDNYGDGGYSYVETTMEDIVGTFALETPITSGVNNYEVICEDRDGDGYYWWGIGEKPATCTGPDQPDGNDADATLGPLDEYGHCIPLNGTPVPVANFSANKTSINKGETVTYTDLSTNNPTSWNWTFEGGTPSTSTAQNPSVSYSTAGAYNVTLTTTNANGSDTKIVDNYIQVNEPIVAPVANFSGTPRSLESGETVSFSDLSTNTPTSWGWTFEGGTPGTSTEQNPTVSYYTAGNHQVTLVATNAGGSHTKVIANYIEVTEPVALPVADFSASSRTVSEGETVSFTDLTSNSPSSWSWTFEGGNPSMSTAQNPSVTYGTAGTYKVTLTATNGDGSDTKIVDNYIQVDEPVVAPIANFSGNPRSLVKGETVTFSDLSTNTPTSWSWTFEGGTPGTSTEQNPTVSYYTSGNNQVTLVATNAGGSHTKVIANYIEVTEPVAIAVAEFSADTRSVNEGESVTFTDLSSNANEWNWTFEGGTPGTSTAQNPTVTYNTVGTYKVTLTAANGDNSDTKTEYNYIQVSEPVTVVVPVASFSADKTTVNTGESVSFSDLSSDATSWSWAFDGGTPGTSTAQNPMVSYSTAGAYKVTLTASNADGSNTKIADNYIQVNVPAVAPLADFSADNTSVTEGQDVTFSDKSVNNPVAWNWNFEGGEPATSTLKNPKIKYNSANNFKVSLTVTNEAGSDTKIVDNFVQVEQYVPSYCTASGSSDSDWIAGVEIDGQTKTSGYNAYSDFTSFGFDLESGNNQDIVLTPGFSPRSKFEYWAVWIDFNQDLAFSDSEKVFSSSKSKSAVSGTIYIPAGMNITTRMRVVMSPTAPTTACGVLAGGEVEDYTVRLFEPAPEADFTASSTTIAVGQAVQFTNTSRYNPTSLQWYFEGGDITESNDTNPIVTYNAPGSYGVTLIVSGDLGTSQKSMTISVSDQVDNTPVYCTPENISSVRNYIRRVVFDGLDFQSGGSGYQLPEATIDNLYGGQVYLADLYPYSNTTRNCWRIWIDFNKDGDFDDADETVLVQNGIKGMVSANVAIPAYADGTTRMRISMKVSKAPLPCENDFIGEVEDYFVTFESPQMKASAPNPSLDLEPQNTITVYPNPTSNFININIGNIEFDDSYTVYDLSGKMMLQNQITSSLTKVDLSTFAPGVYLVRVKNNQQIHTKKIIKKD